MGERMERGSEAGRQQQSPQGYELTGGRWIEEKWVERGGRGGWGSCQSVTRSVLVMILLEFFLRYVAYRCRSVCLNY